jgi:hypothetical protein
MLLANGVNIFLRSVPSPLAHNSGNVLRGFDFPAPVFQFLIGVSLVLFLRKREGLGLSPGGARLAALRRFALLVLLGVLLDCAGARSLRPRWGVLQTLGLGGIVATPLAFAPRPLVAAVTLALLVPFSGAWNGEVHASPLASLAFAPLTLGGLLVGRLLEGEEPGRACIRGTVRLGLAAAVLAAALHAAGIPFNKVLGTSSFTSLAAAVAAATLAALAALETIVGLPGWLVEVGQTALNAWVLQYLLVYYPAWLLFPGWQRLGLGAGLAAIVGTTAALSALAAALGRRGIRIPI